MATAVAHTAFDRAYLAGVSDPLPAERRRSAARRAAAAAPFALGGCVITPDGPLAEGYVVVDGARIAEVRAGRPESVPVLDTSGVILPGLIDLHGHPEFNVFAAWEPPTLFANRYRWRDSGLYHQLIRDPQNTLLAALPPHTQLEYAEVRALVGGVTAIQGASGTLRGTEEALVRNVDLQIFGRHRARSMIDLRPGDQLTKILAGIAAHEVDAFYLHLAEGQPGDERSAREFDRMTELGALSAATVVIHGTALTRDQLGQLRDAGASLVWSPQSNLRLYATTTLAADALDLGLPVALGADWLPTGSASLLAEMKVARHVLARAGRPVAAEDLVAMVTSGAAEIAGLADQLGALAAGRAADVLVLERHHDDPYENVCRADPSWVELVLIGGDLSYGRTDWVRQLAADPQATTFEPLIAWGTPMLLDTSYQMRPQDTRRSLTQLRADLIAHYPQVGPVFA